MHLSRNITAFGRAVSWITLSTTPPFSQYSFVMAGSSRKDHVEMHSAELLCSHFPMQDQLWWEEHRMNSIFQFSQVCPFKHGKSHIGQKPHAVVLHISHVHEVRTALPCTPQTSALGWLSLPLAAWWHCKFILPVFRIENMKEAPYDESKSQPLFWCSCSPRKPQQFHSFHAR